MKIALTGVSGFIGSAIINTLKSSDVELLPLVRKKSPTFESLETDIPNPKEPYAVSKYEAEQGLLKLAKNSSLEVVIIRPPLVYGNNAPGNFGRLIQWAGAKIIFRLPLGAVNNARLLIAIDNLVSFIITCTLHPKAANEIFLISDDGNFSTTQLLRKIATAFNKKALLLPVPISWMIFVA